MHIKKGDQVKITSGKDRGKTGAVLRVVTDTNRVSVEGVNMFKKRMRPQKQGKKGETVSVVRSLHVSNVMLICKNCKKASRTGTRVEGDKRVRFCKNCEATI
jgi:large subunit ribosomal protein L24